LVTPLGRAKKGKRSMAEGKMVLKHSMYVKMLLIFRKMRKISKGIQY
jgi:hypothetical protein